jgi:hypothetical protein
MFRRNHLLGLIAGMFALAGLAAAQDPVTQRPGKSAPPAAPVVKDQASKAPVKFPVVLAGTEDLNGFGKLSFIIRDGGKVDMVDATNKPISGSGRTEGKQIIFSFGNCVYEGTESATNVLTGKARFTSGPSAGQSWNFRVELSNLVQGRTFSGSETLSNYGPVTFRFLSATAVDMVDRDGTSRGSYTINGDEVTMTFGGATYRGVLQGQTLSGTGRNESRGLSWTFNVSETK